MQLAGLGTEVQLRCLSAGGGVPREKPEVLWGLELKVQTGALDCCAGSWAPVYHVHLGPGPTADAVLGHDLNPVPVLGASTGGLGERV